MNETQNYVPGVCNIDSKGMQKRARFGVIMIFAAGAVWAYLTFITSQASNLRYLAVLLPFWLGFVGIWQSKLSFCVVDAFKKRAEIGGKTTKVVNPEHIEKDKRRALQIHMYAGLSAITSTAVLFVISLLI